MELPALDHTLKKWVVDTSLLYESPFTDITPQGPDGLFTSTHIDELVAALDRVRAAAVAT